MNWLKAKKADNKTKLMEFFKKNPAPKDSEIHELAESMNIEPDDLEAQIYALLGSLLGQGLSVTSDKAEYDPEQVKMGIKVEMEHTNDPKIAEKITHDHLSEFSAYYTYLDEMEKKMKKETK